MSGDGRLLGSRQDRLVAAAVAGGLALGLLWSYGRLADGRAAAADLARCRELATRIEQARGRPAVAGPQELRPTDLSRRIEAAAAGVGDAAVERIEPEPARRVGESPYKEVPTRVRLRGVTLAQAFALLHALGEDAPGAPGLRLRSVRLSAPRGQESGDAWGVESTLAHLVYDPAAAPAGRADPK